MIQIILLLILMQFAFSLSSAIALFGCQDRIQDETYELALVQCSNPVTVAVGNATCYFIDPN